MLIRELYRLIICWLKGWNELLRKTDFLVAVPWGLSSQNQMPQISAQFGPYVPTGVGMAHKGNSQRQVGGCWAVCPEGPRPTCVGERRDREADGVPGGKERGNFINHQLPFKNGVSPPSALLLNLLAASFPWVIIHYLIPSPRSSAGPGATLPSTLLGNALSAVSSSDHSEPPPQSPYIPTWPVKVAAAGGRCRTAPACLFC